MTLPIQPVTAGRPAMKVREMLEDLKPTADPGMYGVVMPLTTAIVVESPENVIGFAWRTVDDDTVRIVTLPGRDWESTAQYTGMTKDLYESNIVKSVGDNKEFMDMAGNPMAAYASGILKKSFGMLDMFVHVIDIPRAIAKTGIGLAPANLGSLNDAVSWLNSGSPLRKMKRQDAVKTYSLEVDDRSGLPIIGRNLAMDAALFGKVLDSMVELVEPAEDD